MSRPTNIVMYAEPLAICGRQDFMRLRSAMRAVLRLVERDGRGHLPRKWRVVGPMRSPVVYDNCPYIVLFADVYLPECDLAELWPGLGV